MVAILAKIVDGLNVINKHYAFFQNTECEYFPCHKINDIEDFNCLFCYCPLYMTGERCGGNYHYTNGIKDCSDCLFPHQKNNYEKVIEKLYGENNEHF